MEKDKSTIQVWLDKLQQESWQLELIISSILLFILGSFDDKIPDLIIKYNTNEGFNFAFVVAVIVPLLLFLKSNLIGHILLRGLWVGCIGLRSISKNIDHESFGYAGKFDRFLQSKMPPFDGYTEKLERICSIIFSYSFLMAFHFLSFAIFITIIQVLNYFGWGLLAGTNAEPVLIIVMFILIISGILNFIDFITIGKLKKAKYSSYWFYPFYRIYNIFSLAFLYRPLHYNFISNNLGRKYMLLMIPYMFFLAFAGNEVNFNEYIYIPKKEDRSNWVLEGYYDSLRGKSSINLASIDKLFYNENEPIKLFLRVDDNEETNQLIETLCPNITAYNRRPYIIKPFNTLTITMRDYYRTQVSAKDHKAKIENSLSCVSKMYEISIDSTQLESIDYVFYQHPNAGEKGILTAINIDQLENGKHNLIIKMKHAANETVKNGVPIEIPFFKN